MKTRNIIAGIALITLSAIVPNAFGQRSSLYERLSPDLSGQEEIVYANYAVTESNRIETLRYKVRNWVDSKLIRSRYDAPVVYTTYLVEEADIMYAGEMEVESWMTVPFAYSLEEIIEVESWMTIPFANNMEEIVEVESWMTKPFVYPPVGFYEKELVVEEWMTIPFKCSEELCEEELVVEEWMVTAWF